MQDPKDGRTGPWKYRARVDVLDQRTWDRPGEVIYFVTDAKGSLRLAGQSMSKLKGRWKLAPMHRVDNHQPLGERALFHTSSWPQIERAFDAGEQPPYVVSAIFGEELQALCKSAGGPLAELLAKPQTHHQRLAYHVESWICGLKRAGLPLWNKHKT